MKIGFKTIDFVTAVTVALLGLNSSALAGNWSGTIRERGTKTPLEGINVFILPQKWKATTDAQGVFRFDWDSEISPSKDAPWELVINAPDYRRITLTLDNLEEGKTFSLEKQSYATFETTVVDQAARRDSSKRTLKASEFIQMPGSGGDPIKAIQNLPGINRPQNGSASVVIQGTAPQFTRYHIDGQEVPLIFHFGGLSSVLMPESLASVDYFSAGYGPYTGRALGGLIGVETRRPSQDRLKGFAFVDTINAGALIESPLGKNTRILVGVRQSYIGLLLGSIFADNEDFDLTVAPEYKDGVALLETEVTPIDTFKLTTIASSDTLEFLFKKPSSMDPSLRGGFYNRTAFFRLIPQWTHRHSSRTTSRFSLGLGKDWITIDVGSNYFRLASVSLTTRGEVEKKLTENWTAQWGFDHRYSWADASFRLPVVFSSGSVTNPISTGSLRQADVKGSRFRLLGFYWQNELRSVLDPRLTLGPSIRTEYYSGTSQFIALPRAQAKWDFTDAVSGTVATGWYSQSPEERELSPEFGNPDLNAPRSWHLASKADVDFRNGSDQGVILSTGGFYRSLWDLVETSTEQVNEGGTLVPVNYTNSGKGTVFGAESLVKFSSGRWSGWISYTLARSTRMGSDGVYRLSQYDQTHNLVLLGAVDLPANFRISSKLRFTSGNPNTPVTGGIFDADNDVFVPVRGALYSERLDPFFQWDLRIDKKWIFDQWILSAYIDLQNVTNTKNQEGLQYSYDYSAREKISGLPIIPSLGLKAEL